MFRFLMMLGLVYSSTVWGQKLLWQTNLQSLITTTPTAYNGNIYVATYKKEILGFSQEGHLLFRTVGKAPFISSPLVLSNFLYITSLDGILYSLDAETGTVLWTIATTNSFGSPIASVNNLLFTGSISNTLYTFSPGTGMLLWKASLKGSVYGRPLVDEQHVYVGDFGGYLSQFNHKGQLVWQTNLGGRIFASPIQWGDLVFVSSSIGNLYALRTNGDIVWHISNTKPIVASPAIYENSIIIGGHDGYLSRLEASTGKLLWQTKLSNIIEASPVVGENKIYVADYSGRLFCVEAETGAILWEYILGRAVRSSPILVNGKIVIATIHGLLSVIEVADVSLTAEPSLNPYLTGQEIVSPPEETPLEVVVETNQPTQEDPQFPLIEKSIVLFTNVVYTTNIVYTTNTVVYATNIVYTTNTVEVWQSKKQHEQYVVQVGAFRSRANSQALLRKLQRSSWSAFETRVRIHGKIYYRVRVGYFSSREEAHEAQKQLRKYNLPTMIIREK